ncbi:MAG: helix-turn-helix domain-containing protein [Oscillospiraceae bacterium]|jgi:predicted transcriptional regulator|nr:helix-turn-helix domain-containing protein [Oscillospiraceae bacterium]
MLHIQNLREGLPLFRALSSDVRISIMELLYRDGAMYMSAISKQLGITGGALTPHIKALSDCGLVSVTAAVGKHGVQKICSATDESIMIASSQQLARQNVYETEIGIGQYTAYEVYPTCGICTPDHIIGKVDDPRYFASPERINGQILWFGHGYVEYMIPNFLQPTQELLELQISMEIASEAPGCSENWPSDVHFYLNGIKLGFWTSPADYGLTQGIYNPAWWYPNWNQHGLYKLLSVNGTGAYMDGFKIGDVKLSDLNLHAQPSIALRLAVPEDAEQVGGLTIYGQSFGNYPQGIKVRMQYYNRTEAAE